MEKFRFLVLNPSPANLEHVLEKANAQDAKNGPFEAVLLLGDVLPENTAVPKTDISRSTYFSRGSEDINKTVITSTKPLVTIKSNLFCVTQNVFLIKLSCGLTLAYVTGESADLEAIDTRVDILITYKWPSSIARHELLTLVGDAFVEEACRLLKPRYHFAVGSDEGKFFECKPFEWDDGTVTRFISLAQEGGEGKWFYAFNISLVPSDVDQSALQQNPFYVTKRKVEETAPASTTEEPPKRRKVVSPTECFFCLSNPKVETHMIVSIGKQAYLTTAKGPLTRSNKEMPFSGHGIIIPIEHISMFQNPDTTILENPIFKEMVRFEDALVSAFKNKFPQLKLVFFDINLKKNVHYHKQFLPIHEKFLQDNKFEEVLKEKVRINNENYERNHDLDFKKFNSLTDELLESMNKNEYVMFTLYENETPVYFISIIDNIAKSLDLQFPRRVLSYIIRSPKRLYWEKCQQPKVKEVQDCEEFKNFFRPYDFTLD